MSKSGVIVIIEDDPEDRELAKEIIQDLGLTNEVVCFDNTMAALDYLRANLATEHLLILCDINLPGNDGIQFKKAIDDNPLLRKKSIPFIFLSTAASTQIVNKAYEQSLQGFFIKESSYALMRETFKTIFDYWTRSRHPNS